MSIARAIKDWFIIELLENDVLGSKVKWSQCCFQELGYCNTKTCTLMHQDALLLSVFHFQISLSLLIHISIKEFSHWNSKLVEFNVSTFII
jgi:hypothetical protein